MVLELAAVAGVEDEPAGAVGAVHESIKFSIQACCSGVKTSAESPASGVVIVASGVRRV